jgi:hypothetical protein
LIAWFDDYERTAAGAELMGRIVAGAERVSVVEGLVPVAEMRRAEAGA